MNAEKMLMSPDHPEWPRFRERLFALLPARRNDSFRVSKKILEAYDVNIETNLNLFSSYGWYSDHRLAEGLVRMAEGKFELASFSHRQIAPYRPEKVKCTPGRL